MLDQFANRDNPVAHCKGTGTRRSGSKARRLHHPLCQFDGHHRHHHGRVHYLKEQNPAIQIVGLQPQEGSAIPGIRRWPQEYLPSIFDAARVDRVVDMAQREAEEVMRRLAREEGIFCGVSSSRASVAAMLRLSQEVENAVMVAIVCDRGDRYLSTGVYNAPQA